MNSPKMSVLNDDGIPLNLSTVLILFLMPNVLLILLTIFNAYLVRLSKNHPRLNRFLGKIANFFAKGALDRIISNMLRHFDMKKRQQTDQNIPLKKKSPDSVRKESSFSKNSSAHSSVCTSEKKYDANYLLLVPFQIDLLLTVLIYKILSRDVYPETCQSYLSTYHNRQTQVVCWLKHINSNVSNLSFNISLHQYCTNQTITYINWEHNDVICTHYVFKLINIIDTVTNMFAWHQAIVFIVTKSIVVSYWYQHKLRKTICWSHLLNHHRRIILFIAIYSIVSIYILFFLFLLPIRFYLIERRRVDLTRHLLYACSKFITAIIIHVNLYTLYQWQSHNAEKRPLLTTSEERRTNSDQRVESFVSLGNSEYGSPPCTILIDEYFNNPSTKYLTPASSV